jgi:DDT domain
MPDLHGADTFPVKPLPKKILVDGETFEKLLYIWEFFNNFYDYLEISTFKMEEL